ncbi:hypothetical protein SEMRO_2247_G320651.1 [Seminavis robusta]|uniref:Uncharacterized protein n=1 Tax=Seminavis robusta TaxID=568900 RepID=A0A9N8F0R5_9STRA|nr:hypothetical protein SEMRO_2247_G320651.1 [Seminavis robusta]|eukprot:Sro2247_g320651.1  (482) ;mRNA; f:15103-16548
MPLTKKRLEDLSGQDLYIRAMYRSKEFPLVDDNGEVYLVPPGLSGRQSVKERKYLTGAAKGLTQHLNQHFLQGAIHHATNPVMRALKRKEAGGQRTLLGALTASARWTPNNMALAAKEFEVPCSAKMLLFLPEIFDRAILRKDPKFCYEYEGKDGKTRVGVKTPCPWCKSNKHVSFPDKSGLKAGKHRAIADYRASIPIYCHRIKCSNPQCRGNPSTAKGDDSDKVSSHTILGYSHGVLSLYPKELLQKYAQHLYTEAEDGGGGAIMFTSGLAFEVLRDETNFSELLRHMHDAFERSVSNSISAYVAFLKTQSADLNWPDFSVKNYRSVFGPPKSVDTIIQIFHKSFDLVFPYLQRDLFNRVPGDSIKMDGTFRFLSKTKNDKQSSEETKCLHVVWDQYGYVLSWAFSGPENDECFQRLNCHLRKRCERIDQRDGTKHVDAVKAAFSDTCCQRLEDPTLHWITVIWPSVPRALLVSSNTLA